MTITGSCICGHVRYEIKEELRNARSCHCSKCRKAFSGSGSAYAEIQPGSFSWVSGKEFVSSYLATEKWGLSFCSCCGSTLCGHYLGEIHGVTLGCLDGDPGVEIEMHLFVGSKAPWDHIGGEAIQFEEFPTEGNGTERST